MSGLPRETPILVVDDSAAIRARMEAYLSRLGYTNIRMADSIATGLEAFREQQSEVIFLDLVIDEEKGADFAAEALAERPFVTIVLMTALPSGHEQVTAAIAEGAREYLSKPIQQGNVQAVLERLGQTKARETRSLTHEDVSYH